MFALRVSYYSSLRTASTRRLLATPSTDLNHFLNELAEVTTPNASLTNPPSPPPDAYPPVKGPPAQNPLKKGRRTKKAIPTYPLHIHCKSSRNNTITTLTGPEGNPITWFSGGSCGFKKANRASYEAGYQCAVRIFKRIEEEVAREADKKVEVSLIFKGFGQGRDALRGALLTTEGDAIRSLVVGIVDKTPIKIGGTRAPKARRL